MASDASPRKFDSLLLPAAMFLTTFSLLVFEVALTRAFSVLLRYHYVFMAISLAICGLGLGGLADYLLRRRYPGWAQARGLLTVPLLLLGLLYPAVVLLLFATPLSAQLTSLWVLSAVCLPPFICGGVFVSHLFARYSAVSGYLYFADLLGSALGAIGVIVLLQVVGGINAALVCGLLAAAAALLAAIWAGRRSALTGAVVLLVGLSVLLQQNLTRKFVDLPYLSAEAGPLAKPLYQDLGDKTHPAKIVTSVWNAFARTDVVAYARPDGKYYPGDDLLVYTDGEVPTNMLPFSGDLQKFADDYQGFIGMYPFRNFRPDRVMLIGPGGGLDVLLAESVGAKQIDGAELNPSIPQLVRRYRDFCGPVYDYANVNLQVDEGRSNLSRSAGNYDLIYMALTKTATTASHSMALVESYANTTEAFEEYYRKLSDRGALAFVCQQPPILLRAFATAWLAVQQQAHVSSMEAARHLIVVDRGAGDPRQGPYVHLLIMTKQPLTPERSRELATSAIAQGQEPVFFPGVFEQVPFRGVTTQEQTPLQFQSRLNRAMGAKPGQGWNFAPCPDDRPFVVDLSFGVPPQLWTLTATAAGLVLVLSLLAWPSLRRSTADSAPRFAAQVVYFSLLGAGFMLIEVALIQKLILYLGYPVLSLSVILFALLLGSSLGSLFSQRWATSHLPRRLPWVGAAVAAWGVVLWLLIPALTAFTLHYNIGWRSVLTMALLLPLAWWLGILFPSGLRLLCTRNADAVPWMWGVNGLTSVAGSVLAMIAAKFWGFSAVLLLGLAIYLLVSALILTGAPFGRTGGEDASYCPPGDILEL
ncbi:MAG TPA: hypothetical protein VGM19_11080 [Armatimonadota bacterium]|jgi:hypothetical protein